MKSARRLSEASSAPVGTAARERKGEWDQSVYRRSSAFELNCSGSEWLVLKCVVTGSRLGRRPAAAGWMAGALGRVRGRCGWFLLAPLVGTQPRSVVEAPCRPLAILLHSLLSHPAPSYPFKKSCGQTPRASCYGRLISMLNPSLPRALTSFARVLLMLILLL